MNRPPELSLARARSRGLLMSVLVFSTFANLLMLTGPLFMLQVYDRVLASGSEETLLALFVLVAALYAFYGLLEFARGRVMARVGARFQAALNDRVFRVVLEAAALRRSRLGLAAPQDLEAVRNLLGSPVILALFDILWTPLFLLAIFLFHPLLGWLAVTGGGLLIVIAVLNQLVTRRATTRAQGVSRAAQIFSKQAEDGGELVWSQGMAPAMAERWTRLQDEAMRRTTSASDGTGVFSAFTKAFRLFLQSAVLALGAWLVLQDQMTAGAMVAASILLGRALAPVEQGVSQWAFVQRGRSGWQNLRQLLAEMPERPAPTLLPPPAAQLSLQNVTVMVRPGDPPVLHGVSFELKPGEALGVIGRSGSGKTTLARVVTGTVAPASGEVRISGATLAQYGADRLGGHIGYLPQEVRFFDGTVAENIAQMALAPDPAKVVAAARKAHVHDIVLKLPGGYDTPLGAADAQLSGGQRQRLALARALYNDPVLLVLDEPNSALDAEGSEALNTVIRDMKAAGRAVLVMTHRPTAISACDRLLVLDGGRVAAVGPRDEVIRTMMRNAGDVQRVVTQGGSQAQGGAA